MTTKEYQAIVAACAGEYRRTDNSLHTVMSLQRMIPRIGEAISGTAGNDINGNRRFTIERFVRDVTGDENLAAVYHGQDSVRERPYVPPTWSDMLGETTQAARA